MNEKQNDVKRLLVLDTNVLMHDPGCIFRFQEHDLFLPMVVLEELDNNKRGHSEVARNARQASRFLEELIGQCPDHHISQGLPLPTTTSLGNSVSKSGKLFFQTHIMDADLPKDLPGNKADNSILGIAMALQKTHPDQPVTLVTKDINLRIKAAALDINAEDYYNDRVVEDVDLLYSGALQLEDDFWDKHAEGIRAWKEAGHSFYEIHGDDLSEWYPNQYVHDKHGELDAIVRKADGDSVTIEVLTNYFHEKNSVWGIHARNREQNFALNALTDPNIDFVSLLGQAGTGKTLLALAAGLMQTLDERRYQEIIVTRVTVPVGEDIGFLPGTEEEKMTPWMGALLDNLEVLTLHQDSGEWEKAATAELLKNRIKIRSLNFMRGRTFLNRYVIIDEAQNLTSKQMKTLVTRAGPGTKIVCMGNIAQIDTPYLTETTSGLTYAVDRFKNWQHSAHITLQRGERSRLADYASEIL
ncbi:MAG: PhoH family protein [Gammaproteobacteria bacterium]|nr:PhoH family protein [Gammaproteobacteria bacterium]